MRPSSCFTWSCQVRPSDCDLLGHMNNAHYMTLFEDARRASGSHEETSVAVVEYLRQVQALDVVDIAMWTEQATQMEMTCQGVLMARAALRSQRASL